MHTDDELPVTAATKGITMAATIRPGDGDTHACHADPRPHDTKAATSLGAMINRTECYLDLMAAYAPEEEADDKDHAPITDLQWKQLAHLADAAEVNIEFMLYASGEATTLLQLGKLRKNRSF